MDRLYKFLIILCCYFSTFVYGDTPLLSAIHNDDFREVYRLVYDKNVDLNEKGSLGISPLHYAAQFNHINTLLLLIEEGADLEIKDPVGQTPLFYAVINNSFESADILLNLKCEFGVRRAFINAQDNNGRTVAHWACALGNLKALEHLKESGACFDIPDNDHNLVSDFCDEIEARNRVIVKWTAKIKEPTITYHQAIQRALLSGRAISASSIKESVSNWEKPLETPRSVLLD